MSSMPREFIGPLLHLVCVCVFYSGRPGAMRGSSNISNLNIYICNIYWKTDPINFVKTDPINFVKTDPMNLLP